MKRIALLGLLLLGSFQAASGSARHLSEFASGDQVTVGYQLDGTPWLLPDAPPNRSLPHKRTLAQLVPDCPIQGCDPNNCNPVNGGYTCGMCQPTLVLKDNRCHCPVGMYADFRTCKPCTKNHYCIGGEHTGPNVPAQVACPIINEGTAQEIKMLTQGRGSPSITKCVNPPGTSYKLVSSTPSAEACPPDTFCPGMRKQRACPPCPTGYTTAGQTRQTNLAACVVPAGYFLKSLGLVAPCPQGEYKEGIGEVASCTRCHDGVTTPDAGSTSASECHRLLPSFYAVTIDDTSHAITATAKCPRGFICPGGDATAAFNPAQPDVLAATTVVKCPAGTLTQDVGASSPDECLTPPGFKATLDNGVPTGMVECVDGEYRAEWKPPSAATACVACGDMISSWPTEQITIVDNSVPALPIQKDVRAGPASCYIKPGQGMTYNTHTQKYSGMWCNKNNYGVAGDSPQARFGLDPMPCKPCPLNLVTPIPTTLPALYYYDVDGSVGGNGGFTDPQACVTQAGWGYNGRVSYRCPVGYYNPAGNREACQKCGFGLTTLNDPTKQVSADDCGLAAGFGLHDGVIIQCPIGTYSQWDPQNPITRTKACTPCQTLKPYTTTAQPGSRADTDCSLCLPGYGSDPAVLAPNCRLQCGGVNGATFGRPVRDIGTACEACPVIHTGFFFMLNSVNEPYVPTMVARPAAESEGDCLAEFAQIGESGAWYLGGSVAMERVIDPAVDTLEECAANCKVDVNCQYITFDYNSHECYKKVTTPQAVAYAGLKGEVLAFKAVSAGDTGAASKSTKGKASASGVYTFYWEESTAIGLPSAPLNPAPATFQACLDACDADQECAAAGMVGVTRANDPKEQPAKPISSCRLIRGFSVAGRNKRSLTKVDLTRVTLPAAPTKKCADAVGAPCGTHGTCNGDGSAWGSCSCPGTSVWDVVLRDCAEFTRVLRADKSFLLFTTSKKVFVQARQECFKYGAELASVHDAAESSALADAVSGLTTGATPAVQYAWLGLARANYPMTLIRTDDKSQWTWMSTHQLPEWDGWGNGQPDAATTASYSQGVCGDVRLSNGKWYDARCSDQLPYVCMNKDFCANDPCNTAQNSGATCEPDPTAWQGYRCKCTVSGTHWKAEEQLASNVFGKCAEEDFTHLTLPAVTGTKPERKFLLFNTELTFDAAYQRCLDRQAQLATFVDRADQAEVVTKFNEDTGLNIDTGSAWLGLASSGYPDIPGDGQYAPARWMWITTGVRPDFFTQENWAPGFPSNTIDPNAMCGAMNLGPGTPKGQWSHPPCSEPRPFVCLE